MSLIRTMRRARRGVPRRRLLLFCSPLSASSVANAAPSGVAPAGALSVENLRSRELAGERNRLELAQQRSCAAKLLDTAVSRG